MNRYVLLLKKLENSYIFVNRSDDPVIILLQGRVLGSEIKGGRNVDVLLLLRT